ncbi:MAG: hypothetical protein GWN87_23570 [Desulfuromonadales bacterium]|nr:hypothetical protein [Desulfuromonadales bacterium]NIS42835.1 hypothetical protein [Desulfuromonadales bacterium]
MFKLLTLMMSMLALCGAWYGGGRFPRLTGSDLDYFLMPFCGYLALMVAANIAARLIPEREEA